MDNPQPSEQMTNIETLPNEILAQVFRNLPYTETWRLLNVSKRWRSVVDSLVGIRAYIGKPSEFWTDPALYQWQDMDRISQMGLSTVSFSDIEAFDFVSDSPVPIEASDTSWRTSSIRFKYPNLVQRLSFDGFIHHSTFIALLSLTTNLVYLELHLSTLELIDCSVVDFNLPKLKELIISANNFSIEHMAYSNLGKIMLNCAYVLERPFFPRLTTLRLYVPVYVQRSNQLLRALFLFFVRHQSTLKTFLIRTEMRVSEASPATDAIEPVDIAPYLALLKSQSQQFLLKVFRVTLWTGDPDFVEFFRLILNQQRQLSWCGFVTHNDYQPLQCQVMQRNFATLKKLHLSVQVVDSSGTQVQLDCQHLECCERLEQLGLIGNRTIENTNIGNGTKPDLLNVAALPKKLQFVEVYNATIGHEDVHVLATGLEGLKTLHLENIGDYRSMGMTLETLVSVFRRKNLEKLGVVSGFNRRSLSHCGGSGDEDPGIAVAKLLLSKESSPTLLVTFQPDGNIVWGYKEEEDKLS